MKRITKYDTVKSGAFVGRNPERCALPEDGTLWITYKGITDIKNYILHSIQNATKYIKLSSYLITDKEIVKALLDRAKKYDLVIFVLTQLDDRNITDSFLSDEELNNSSGKDHLTNLGQLNRAGVHIRAASDIHAKFFIVDGEHALITSANITDNSMNNIPELGCIVDDERLEELERVFDLIYKHGAPFKNFAIDSQGNQNIRQTKLEEIDTSILPSGSSGFSYTYRNQIGKLYEDIIQIISDAKSDIYILTFSIKQLEKLPELVQVIKEAIERGIQINIFCRAMNHREDHLKACKELNGLGCVLRGDVFNHAKGVVNNEQGLIFSANLDGEYGLKNGFEVGTATFGEERNDLYQLSKFFFETAPFEYKEEPRFESVFGYFSQTYAEKNARNKLVFDLLNVLIDPSSDFDLGDFDQHFLYGIIEEGQVIGVEIGGVMFNANLDWSLNELRIGSQVKHLSSSAKFIFEFDTLKIDYGKS